jgi:hypothetical protein
MELDDLKERWKEMDRRPDQSVRFDAAFMGALAANKVDTATRRLSRLLTFELAVNVVAAVWLGSFSVRHLTEPRFLVPGLVLHAGIVALLVTGARQLVATQAVDYGASVIQVQKRLVELHAVRVRSTVWTLVLAPLAWTPLQIVALKGFLGIDAYAALGGFYLLANALFGVGVLGVSLWASRRFSDRMKGSPLIQRLTRDLSGRSLADAISSLASLSGFEKDDRPDR